MDHTLFHENSTDCRPRIPKAVSSKSRHFRKEGTPTSYREVIYYRLDTYDTDNLIAKMDGEILQFIQLSNMTPRGYAEAL